MVGSGQETVVDSVSYPGSQAVDDLYHPCPASQANLMGVNVPLSVFKKKLRQYSSVLLPYSNPSLADPLECQYSEDLSVTH